MHRTKALPVITAVFTAASSQYKKMGDELDVYTVAVND
jgi:hypothetical protein